MLNKLACLVVMVILLFVSLDAFAESAERGLNQTRYDHTLSVYAGLSISGSTALCNGKGRGLYSDTTTSIQVTLQRRPSGSNSWYGVTSWTDTANGTDPASVCETYTVSAGYSYRVRVRCQIKDSNGNVLETVYQYSTICTI